MDHLLHFAPLSLIFFLISSSSLVQSQQPYIGNGNGNCVVPDSNTTSGTGYTCNGAAAACQSYLIFRSQPPTYDSVSTISNLLSADPAQIARLNSVSEDAIFPANKTVLIPVNCSCSGRFSQHNTSYVIQPGDGLQKVATDVYKGLSTCKAIQAQNPGLIERNLAVGTRIQVPLRCACPTKNQTDSGVRYLLSYLIATGDFVSTIAARFGADLQETYEANGLSDQDFTIFPDTTLLLPLRTIPSSSQIMDPPSPPSGQSTPATPPPSGGGGGSSKTWIYALAGALGAVSVISTSLLLFICLRNRKRKAQKRASSVIVSESYESVEKPFAKKGPTEDMASSDSFWDSMSSIAQSMTVYTYEELRLATDDFSSDCLIGGSVYLGTIKGDLAAIKKVSRNVSEEINLLNKINHMNLIRLSGVSFFDGFWYLVFEYAQNGSLDDWIYGSKADQEKKNDKVLSWMQRMQIAFDVASGLNYLHSYTSPPHVHKDLKCSNVLIDAEFRAKITNFGLARSTNSQGGQFALTRHIVGTKGYMAPEYLENGLVSPKLDVYSFGVLLLEILTGKEVALNSHLAESLVSVQKDGNEMVGDFMDGSLGGRYPSDLAVMVIRLADGCLKKDPSARPGMHEIVQTLSTTIEASVSWESERASN